MPCILKILSFEVKSVYITYFIYILERTFELRFVVSSELIWILIDSIISQMHKKIIATSIWRIDIFFRSKSTKAIPIHEGYKVRLYLSHQNIYTEVEFSVINKVWLCLIMLDYVAFITRDVFNFPCDKYSFTLALILWLDNQGSTTSSALLSLLNEVVEIKKFIWSDPSLWKEIKLFWESLLHQLKILS